jgi:hypothetical protein
MALPADVPELEQNDAAFGMHGVGHLAPAGDLFIAVDPGRAEIAAALHRNRRRLGDLETAFRGALAVIFDHHRARYIARLIGAQPGQRCLDDTMVEMDRTDLDRFV